MDRASEVRTAIGAGRIPGNKRRLADRTCARRWGDRVIQPVDDLQLHCGVVSFQCVRVELEHDQTLSGKTAGEEGMSSLTVTAEWAEHLIAAVSDRLYQPEGIRQG